jgi:hypothetical protein
MSKFKARQKSKSKTAPTTGASSPNPKRNECVITIELTRDWPDFFKRSKNVGRPAWAGAMFDLALFDDANRTDPIFRVFVGDSTANSRDGIISDLQGAAFRDGYTHCEVRNYLFGTKDSYETMYSGPVPDPDAAFS